MYADCLTMPEPRNPSEEFTLDEAVIAQMYEHEALLNLLIEKGVFTKEEMAQCDCCPRDVPPCRSR